QAPAARPAQGVDVDLDDRGAQGDEPPVEHADHLRVAHGPRVAVQLASRLVDLAVAPALGPLRAEHRPEVVPAGLRLSHVHRLTDVHPGRARRAFGAQREGLAAALEGEHLLLDDLAGLSRRLLEQLLLFENGRAQLLVAVRLDRATEDAFEPLPPPGLVGEDVVHSTGRDHRSALSRAGLAPSSSYRAAVSSTALPPIETTGPRSGPAVGKAPCACLRRSSTRAS